MAQIEKIYSHKKLKIMFFLLIENKVEA